jgi:predicted nucleic acid-binding protein
MAEQKIPICIDSCVIISYLKGGTDRTDIDKGQLFGFFDSVWSGNTHVIFPTILRTELLECNLGDGLIKEFDKLVRLQNFDEFPVNTEVAKIAAKIRSFYLGMNRATEEVPTISMADSIFLATAIENGCAALYTYDGDRVPPRKPSKLLGLRNPIAGEFALNITKPSSAQVAFKVE